MTNDDFVDASILYVDLAKDNLANIAWKTADRKIIPVKDMEDLHLRNCALFLMGMGYQKCIAPEPIRIAWLTVFRMEWARRELAKAGGGRKFRVNPERFIRDGELLND